MPCVRPAEIPLGTVWRRFKGQQKNGVTPPNYQICDMRPEDHEQCLKLMKEIFIRDEPLAQALDLGSDPVSIDTVTKNWEKYLNEQISLSCYTENDRGEPQELVGFNILLMKSIDDPQEDLDQEQTCDVFKYYGVQRYLSSSGLIVSSEHRGQNIGVEIFKSREPLCKALCVEATATVFTAVTSQVLASKCGYKPLGETDYSSLLDKGVDIKKCGTASAKLMGTRMPWVRPADVPLGTVWRRFKGRERHGRPGLNYQIRDIRPEDHKPCLELMKEVFIRDEPLVQALDVAFDPVSLRTIVKNWEKYLEDQISLACYTENDKGEPQELVAFNILLIKNIDDPDEDLDKVEGEPWKKLLRTLIAGERTCDVFKHYSVDRYLTSSGLTVRGEHRGQNIGAEMFRAREPLCKALGVEATATVFTALTSQVLAAKCGYELLGELEYSSMLEKGIDLTKCGTPTAKHMGIKFKF